MVLARTLLQVSGICCKAVLDEVEDPSQTLWVWAAWPRLKARLQKRICMWLATRSKASISGVMQRSAAIDAVALSGVVAAVATAVAEWQ